MHGPLDFILGTETHREELVVMTTDRDTGTVTGAISLGESWDALLCELVVDAGRRAQMEGPGVRSS